MRTALAATAAQFAGVPPPQRDETRTWCQQLVALLGTDGSRYLGQYHMNSVFHGGLLWLLTNQAVHKRLPSHGQQSRTLLLRELHLRGKCML